MNPIYVYYGYPKSKYIDELKNSERKRQEQYDQLKTGIKAIQGHYKTDNWRPFFVKDKQ